MLTACGHDGAQKPSLRLTDPDPVVQTKTVREVICPADLYRELPPEPQPAAGAVVRTNDQGSDYLQAKIGRGDAAVQVIEDTKRACTDAQSYLPPPPAQ